MSTKQAKMLELRKEGLDATEIAGKLKTSRGYVQNVLSKHGATKRRRQSRQGGSTFSSAATALRQRARHYRRAAREADALAKKLEQVG